MGTVARLKSRTPIPPEIGKMRNCRLLIFQNKQLLTFVIVFYSKMFVYIYYLLLFCFDWMVFGVLIVVNMYMINLILISDVLEKDKKRSTRSTQIAPYLVS